MYYLEKEFWICCSHRLHNSKLTIEENKEIFGRCNNEPSHGHNYQIILKLRSKKLSPDAGMIMNFYDIKEIFNRLIDEPFDHKYLNDCIEFKDIIPTAENMCKIFFDILCTEIDNLCSVKIYETTGACAEYAI